MLSPFVRHFRGNISVCYVCCLLRLPPVKSSYIKCPSGAVADPVLQFLMMGLQQPLLATMAANSLQSICSQCQEQMINHFPGLLQIVQAVDSFNVANEAAIGLLKGVSPNLPSPPSPQLPGPTSHFLATRSHFLAPEFSLSICFFRLLCALCKTAV